MEGFNNFPISEEQLPTYYKIEALRDQITNAALTSEGKVKLVSPRIIEETLNGFLSPAILDAFNHWNAYKSEYREALFKNVLGSIALVGMLNADPDKFAGTIRDSRRLQRQLVGEAPANLEEVIKQIKSTVDFSPRIEVSIRTEGKYSTSKHGISIPLRDEEKPVGIYTLDELILNSKKIFPTHEDILNNDELREKFVPTYTSNKRTLPAVLTSVQYQLRIVGDDGKYKVGTSVVYFREKFPHSFLKKFIEYLVGVRANGKSRDSVDDHLGAMLIVPKAEDMWDKTFKILKSAAEVYRIHNLEGAITLRDYDQEGLNNIAWMKEYFLTKKRSQFLKGRGLSEADFEYQTSEGQKDRCAEILLPVGSGNIACLQVYTQDDHTRVEGVMDTNHLAYKTKQEEEMRQGWTNWQWSLLEKIHPYFIGPYMIDSFIAEYGELFDLDRRQRDYNRLTKSKTKKS